jgi:hypothetical protein
MAATLKTFEEGLGRMADRTRSMDQHFGDMEVSVTSILKNLIGIHAVQSALSTLMSQSKWGRDLKMAYGVAKTDLTEMMSQHVDLLARSKEFNQTYKQRVIDGEITKRQAAVERRALEEQVNLIRAQLQFKRTLQSLHPAELAFSSAFLTATVAAYRTHKQINEALIEGNSSLSERLQLTRSVLLVQRQLGSETQTTVDAARDLVDYGYDLDQNFESTLKLVVQLKDGLGMSTKLGSELAVVYERQLKVSARDVSDSMARIVNDTALAADEAGRMAVNIGRAVAMLRPGVSGDLAAVNQLVGRYEGALKALGGQFGGFHELLTKMATPEGLLQAGILGINDPSFIASEQATKQVVDSFASYAKNFLGNTEGWARAMRLQALSEMFGTTAAQVNLMIQAVDKANEQRTSAITLEQRFNEQVVSSGQVLARLKNSMVTLAQEGALPLIGGLTHLLSGLSGITNWLIKFPEMAYVATTVMAGGAILAVTQLYRVSRALAVMAAAAHTSARAVQRKVATDALAALPGTGGAAAAGSGVAARIGQVMGAAAGPIMASAIGAAIAIGVGALIRKTYYDVEFKQVSLARSTDEAVSMTLRRLASKGDTEGVKDALIRARGMYLQDGLDLAAANDKIANQVAKLPEIVGNVRFAKKSAESSLGPSKEEVDSFDKLTGAQAELIDIAAQQRDNAIQTRKIQEQQLKKVEQQQETQEKQGLLQQAAEALNFLDIRTAWDFDYFKGRFR